MSSSTKITFNEIDEDRKGGDLFNQTIVDGDNLYEIQKLINLEHSGDCDHIRTVINNERFYLVINNTLKIFANRSCRRVIYEQKFDGYIDCLSILSAHKLIVLCLRNGTVHFINNSTKFETVYTEKIVDLVQNNDGELFIGCFPESNTNIFLVTKSGNVYRLTLNSCSDGEFNVEFSLFKQYGSIECVTFSHSTLIINSHKLSVMDLNGYSDTINGYRFRKIRGFNNLFFGLDFNGGLSIIVPTLTIFPIQNQTKYVDFEIIIDSNNYGLIIAVTELDESNDYYIHILTIPQFQIVHSFRMTHKIYLIKPEKINDELMFITKSFNDSNNQMINLNICELIETKPENRLKRLLINEKFDEAKSYAMKHSISLELINRTKIELIYNSKCCDHDDINELLKLYDTIDDIEFILESFNTISYKNIDDIERILTYGITRKSKQRRNRKNIERLRANAMKNLYKFNVFKLIYKDDKLCENVWWKFVNTNMLTTVINLLENKRFDQAAILYRRLDDCAINSLNDSSIQQILNIINQQSFVDYQPFLTTFIPITLKYLPSVIPLLIEWIQMKVFTLEKEEVFNFPTNAISLLDSISKFFKFVYNTDLRSDNCLSNLKKLSIILDRLEFFKTTYNLIIPLDTYLSDVRDTIKYLLNIRVNIENYNKIVHEVVLNLIIENHLNIDDILFDEITNIMSNGGGDYWIARIKLLLNWINSLDKKLQTVQNILYLASVPYSIEIKEIAQDTLQYSHPIVDEIRQLLHDEPIRIVLNRCEYDFIEKSFNGIDDLRFFVNRIIYCNLPTMMDDIKTLCRTSRYLYEANLILVRNYLEKSDYHSALELLSDVPQQELLKYVQYFFIAAETELSSSKFHFNYFEILWSIYNRCEFKSKFEQECYQNSYNQLKSVNVLYRKFDIKLTISEWKMNKKEIFNNLIDLLTNFNNIDELFTKCNEISIIFSIDISQVLIKICNKLNDINVILKTAEQFLEQVDNCHDLCLMCILLLKTISFPNIRLNNTTLFDESTLLPLDQEIPMNMSYKVLKLANQLSSKALINANPDEERSCLEICDWTNVVYYINGNGNLRRYISNDVCCDLILATKLTYETIGNMFKLYCDFICYYNYPNQYVLYFKDNSGYSLEDLSDELTAQLRHLFNLVRLGQICVSYKLLKEFYESLSNINDIDDRIFNNLKNMLLKDYIPSLLKFTLQKTHPDMFTIQSLILCLDIDSGRKFLINSMKVYKRIPEKFNTLSLVGYHLYSHLKINPHEFTNTILTIKWWKKCNQHPFEYDEFFKCSNENRLKLILNHTRINVGFINDYCKDFKLNPQFYYQQLLVNVLSQWKPDYQINNGTITIKNTYEDLLKVCLEIVGVIEDVNSVVEIITRQWNLINFYYYEVFIVMINILSNYQRNSDNDKKLSALAFLMNYQRCHRPSENETELWFTTFPDKQIIDELSEYRLPFINKLFTKDIWNIIRSEITLSTYKSWFQHVGIWNTFLNQDEICCFAIKNLVSSKLLSSNTNDQWILYSKYDNLFDKIDECVRNIVDLEKTTSVLYYVLAHTPNGADKVNAAKLCYKYALKYKNIHPNDGNIEAAFIKIEKKFFFFSVTHILNLNKLDPENYKDYLNRPEDLIQKLYKDVQDTENANINKSVDDIAELFNLTVFEIRKKIIYKWIFNNNDDLDDINYNDNHIKRLIYICESDIISWSNILYETGMDDSNSFSVRANALTLYELINDIKSIEKTTKLSYDEFKSFVKKINLLNNLQHLGFDFDLDTLNKYNKHSLLEQLAQVPNKYTIKTMAVVCMAYSRYDTKHWKFIIGYAIKWSMISELKTYVEFIECDTECVIKQFFTEAWQKIIDHSFASIKDVPKDKLDDLLINNFRIIQSCPALSSINLETVYRRCIEIGKTTFAALLLQYLNENREEFIKEIINCDKDVVEELDELIGYGFLGVSKVKSILNINNHD